MTDRDATALAAHEEYRAKGYDSIPIRLDKITDDRGVEKKRPKFPGGTWKTAREIAGDPDRLRSVIEKGFVDVALVCEGIAALDFDERDGETEEDLKSRARDAAVTYGLRGAVVERTARGFHVLSRAPKENGRPWRKLVHGPPHLVDEIQVGEGALIFVAPSFHPLADRPYERLTDLRPVDELPECPVELLTPPVPSEPPARAPRVPRQTGPRSRGDWSTLDVVGLFRAAGMYGKDLGGGKHGVRCPWEGDHTTGSDGTDTVVYEADGTTGPGFRCLHAHCEGRGIREVREHFGTEEVDRWCTEEYRAPDRPKTRRRDPGDSRTEEEEEENQPVRLEDFRAYLPDHSYIFKPTREMWSTASVNAVVPKRDDLKASTWLDRHRNVHQMTWMPGEPMIVEDRLIDGGGWISRPGMRVFNHYRGPAIELGDPAGAGLWIDHVHALYPDEAGHLIRWLAHRVQQPAEKVNHAIALIGPQGTGKDTIVEGVIHAVGPWNVAEVSPNQVMGRFNGFLKSVILRVSESRDLGDTDRYGLYDHLKTYTAAPPDFLRVDEKHLREYMVPNVTGVMITSNHTDGIYLPADDRRHFVAVTELTKDDFTAKYWADLYEWYEAEGYSHVAAYLADLDLSGFNPKAPPPKTDGFWQVVDAGRAPEDAELADVLDRMQWPDVLTKQILADRADEDFRAWLTDRRNARNLSHRLESAGYVPIRNDAAKDGLWRVDGKRQAIYAKKELAIRDRIGGANRLMEASR